ncbi:MAG: hypothetical protein LBV14_13550, partial [Acidovorax sp.]|nr:hypothetical protein [Acidovorax sp.]
MGVFDKIKRVLGGATPVPAAATLQTTAEPAKPSVESMTIKATPALFACYDRVFATTMQDVAGISSKDKQTLLKVVNSGPNGFLDMSHHLEHYETFFRGKSWSWGEYEKWDAIFKKAGRYPRRFPAYRPEQEPDNRPSALFPCFNKVDLLAICADMGVVAPDKAKKADLINLLLPLPGVEAHPVFLKAKRPPYDLRKDIFMTLMRTMNFRAKSLHTKKRALSIHPQVRFEVGLFDEEGEGEFVRMALREN